MITLVPDSNALRHRGLAAFLRASRGHAVALSDLTLVGMRKIKAPSTSRESIRIPAPQRNTTSPINSASNQQLGAFRACVGETQAHPAARPLADPPAAPVAASNDWRKSSTLDAGSEVGSVADDLVHRDIQERDVDAADVSPALAKT